MAGSQDDEEHHAVPPRGQEKGWRPWLKKHRASVVVALCFLTVLAATLALSLVLGPKTNKPIPLLSPSVNLDYAQYIGRHVGNGVNEFLGMRYAAAPIGDFRWRAPVEPPVSHKVQPALKFKPTCLGNDTPSPALAGQDEDCLFVNVWAPANATTDSKLPVWVFIQGGGYIANSMANYDGAEVVKKSGLKIVMVNFNYRVGIFGFLASERIKEDGDLNVGLLDQRRLLLWVKQYIAQFGGDPEHVVIHGASAGAGSVALHLSAYGGRDDGLFVGAILESLFFPGQPYLHELEWQFDAVALRVGCDSYGGHASQMACLRSKDMATLQALNAAAPFPGRKPANPLWFWTPCVEGDLIQDLPYVLFQTGRFIKVPVMFGTCTNEGSVFTRSVRAGSRDDVATFFQDNYYHLTTSDTASILARYPQLPSIPGTAAWFPTLSKAYGDATFTCPSVNLLWHITTFSSSSSSSSFTGFGASNNISNNVFAYRYNVQDAANLVAGLGVPHVYDAAAIFGPTSLPAGSISSYLTANAPIVPVLMGYYISFVRALDPNLYRDPASPAWGVWGRAGARLKVETGHTCMEEVAGEEVERCAFWEGLGVQMRQRRG